MKKCLISIVFIAFLAACARADEPPAPPVKTPVVVAKDAQAVVDALNMRAENLKLKIQLLQAQRKQIEYEYSANCYKDRRWRDYTSNIEDLTKQLEQFLIGGSK